MRSIPGSPLVGVFDLFTIVVAVVGYSIGRNRGLVWQLSGVATLVVGGLSATILSTPVGPLFAEGVLGRFLAWIAIYIVVGVCLYVLTLKLKDKIKEMEFEELDKRFGGMLGGFKALCIFALVVLVAVAISDSVGLAVKNSATGRTLGYLVQQAHPLIPDKIHDAFDRIHPDEDSPTEAEPIQTTPAQTPPSGPAQTPPSGPAQTPPSGPAQATPSGPAQTTAAGPFKPGSRPPPDATPRPNPFETPPPPPAQTSTTNVFDVDPLEPSAEINVPEIQPLPPEDAEPDPFDTTQDEFDPLAPGGR